MRLHTLLCAVAASLALASAARADAPFPLPDIPEAIEDFTQRTTYMVDHFWDRCDFRAAMSRRTQLGEALDTYLGYLPLVPRQNALDATRAMIAKAGKASPEALQYMVERAEGALYSDSARYTSDEVWLCFLDAAAASRKIDKSARERYSLLRERVASSMTGSPAPDVPVTLRDGSATSLGAITAADSARVTVLWLCDPEAPDFALQRLRIGADTRLKGLVDDGQLRIVVLYPGEPSQAWAEAAAAMPEQWTVGASPQALRRCDMLVYPAFWILDTRGSILHKYLSADNLLQIFYNI